MSRRRDIDRRLHSLGEIEEIMNAMKNLALMETHKLTRFLSTQRRAVASIQAAATDFLSFHSHLLSADDAARDVYLLIGSERGFCGNFNEALLQAVQAQPRPDADPALITIGTKLGARWADDARVVSRLAGPSALEEVETVLLRLMEALGHWQAAQSAPRAFRVTVFHHAPEEPQVRVTRLDPFDQWTPPTPRFGYAPLLNLEPRLFLTQLAEHYLFAALHELFYSSLMAENQHRTQHMDYAVQRIEQNLQALFLERNRLRQEEITEEIEIIMLSMETP
jgi:F-type H+-transporting ATPase subunit gamma